MILQMNAYKTFIQNFHKFVNIITFLIIIGTCNIFHSPAAHYITWGHLGESVWHILFQFRPLALIQFWDFNWSDFIGIKTIRFPNMSSREE